MPLTDTTHSLTLNEEAVHAGAQTDLDERGIPKTARDEQLAARNAELRRLYRQHVLKEQPTIQIRRGR